MIRKHMRNFVKRSEAKFRMRLQGESEAITRLVLQKQEEAAVGNLDPQTHGGKALQSSATRNEVERNSEWGCRVRAKRSPVLFYKRLVTPKHTYEENRNEA